MKLGKLYIVPLPIGNLEDITLRAQRVLQEVDVVAAEDTRNFHELASALKISVKRVLAYHDHNEDKSAEGLLQLLKQGQSVAIVSDAGTPGVSDPGFSILRKCFENQITVEPLPGPSSLVTALSACPLGGTSHAFFGFMPSRSNERKQVFQNIRTTKTRNVFFESPHRMLEHLEDAHEIFGNIQIFVAREITKKFQEYLYWDLSELIQHFTHHPPKGEFVVIYPELEESELNQTNVEEIVRIELKKGRSSKEILEILKGQSSLSRSEVYDMIQKVKEGPKKTTDK